MLRWRGREKREIVVGRFRARRSAVSARAETVPGGTGAPTRRSTAVAVSAYTTTIAPPEEETLGLIGPIAGAVVRNPLVVIFFPRSSSSDQSVFSRKPCYARANLLRHARIWVDNRGPRARRRRYCSRNAVDRFPPYLQIKRVCRAYSEFVDNVRETPVKNARNGSSKTAAYLGG